MISRMLQHFYRMKDRHDDSGFSLLEIVITTTIIMIITSLSVVQLTDTVDGTRKDAEQTAAEQTRQLMLKYALDGDDNTDPLSAASIYNRGSTETYGVTVEIKETATATEYTIEATHADSDPDDEPTTLKVRW